MLILDFSYVASIRRQSASNAMGSKIEAKSQTFDPVKTRGGMGEMAECHFQVESRTQP